MPTPTRTQCKTCVLDRSAKEIVFTETGCNFCDGARKEWIKLQPVKGTPQFLWAMKDYVKIAFNISRNDKYDVLCGLSGGADSSYALLKAVELGLRPLCFSIDTGYNKPEADENIMKLVEGLKVPFIRYTIDLKNFKAMQASFMKAGVPNIEIPTDHVLMAASYKLAAKYGIKTILSGGNVATESIMPASWGYNARDLRHIKSIYRGSYKGLPTCGILKWNYYRWVKKIKVFYLLDYLHYNRKEAEQVLHEKVGYVSTGGKHEENYFTWWFQNWYLFEKFGIDKRKAHLSSLIVSGQITRQEALGELEKDPVYPKLGIEEKVLKYKKRAHEDYPMDPWYDRISKVVKWLQI